MMKSKIFSTLVIALMIVSCSQNTGKEARLTTDTDSVAYVIGMNVGLNLIRMDSTLNIEAVCQGLRDVARNHTKLSLEEAETFFLGYMNYTLPEKAQALEEQWLAELAEQSRDFARTRTGITYAVRTLGDQVRIPAASRDSLALRYLIRTTDNKVLYSSYERGDTIRTTLSDLKSGLQESVKLIGEGGKVEAWIPSQLAFGAEGNSELNIAPNKTLCFEIELIQLDKYTEWTRR